MDPISEGGFTDVEWKSFREFLHQKVNDNESEGVMIQSKWLLVKQC